MLSQSFLRNTYFLYVWKFTCFLFILAGEDLRHPEQLLSRYNILEMDLTVQMSKVTVGGWLELWRRTYNKNIGGPTWRVKPGDTIAVNLVGFQTSW